MRDQRPARELQALIAPLVAFHVLIGTTFFVEDFLLGRVSTFHDIQVWEITWGHGVSRSGDRLLRHQSRTPGRATHASRVVPAVAVRHLVQDGPDGGG